MGPTWPLVFGSLEELAWAGKEGECLKDTLYDRVTSLNLEKISVTYPSLNNHQL